MLSLVAASALAAAGCADPPNKEMQQAQGAIEAARAAGADKYAHDELAAADAALKAAHDAVAQSDYRLALNNALSSREHAQEAAKPAAENMAAARADADRALVDVTRALSDAQAKLKVAEGAHVPARTLTPARRSIAGAEIEVQKAREAFRKGDYTGVRPALGDATGRLRATAHDLDAAAGSPGRRRR
jgi:hypothetical protein